MSSEITAKKKRIEDKLSKHIPGFESRVNYNRKKTYTAHVLIVLLGGFVTLSNGLNKYTVFGQSLEDPTQITSMILGILITGIATYNGFFNNKKLWVVYNTTSNELKKIRDDYEFYIAGKDDAAITIDELIAFNNRIQKVLDETNNHWTSAKAI